MKKIILLASAMSVLFFACKKKEDKPATPADMLQNGKWKLTSATALGGTVDLTTTIKACQKDNLYTFNADKTITLDEGPTKCNVTDISPRTDGNWNMTADYKQITVSGSLFTSLGISSLTGDVVKIDATTVQLKKDTTIIVPTTANITFTNVK